MKIEIRADNSVHIEGYVNAVERDSNIINVPSVGRCVEQIRAGAFDQALSSGADVAILENHDISRKLGSTSQGNLLLHEDSIGLRASADISDEDIAGKARRGELKGWSFGFICTDSEIEQRAGNVPRRIVKGMTLSEVSLIDGAYKPCYNGTLVEVRSEGNFMEYRSCEDEATEIIVEERAEEPDYSYYDALLRYHELRYNPYHDPGNGRFCSGGGGGGGAIVVKQGDKSYKEDVQKYGRNVARLAHSDKSLTDLDKEIETLKTRISALDEEGRQEYLSAVENLNQQIKDTYKAKMIKRKRDPNAARVEAEEKEKARQKSAKEYQENMKRRLTDWSGVNDAVGSSKAWQRMTRQIFGSNARAESEDNSDDPV